MFDRCPIRPSQRAAEASFAVTTHLDHLARRDGKSWHVDVVLRSIADGQSWSGMLVPRLAEEADLATLGGQEVEGDFQQCGLAATIGADQAEHASRRDGEIDRP